MFQTTMRMCVNVYVLYMCVVGVGGADGGWGWGVGGWVGGGVLFRIWLYKFYTFLILFLSKPQNML